MGLACLLRALAGAPSPPCVLSARPCCRLLGLRAAVRARQPAPPARRRQLRPRAPDLEGAPEWGVNAAGQRSHRRGGARARAGTPRAPPGRLRRLRAGAGAGAGPRVRGHRGRDGRPPARTELRRQGAGSGAGGGPRRRGSGRARCRRGRGGPGSRRWRAGAGEGARG